MDDKHLSEYLNNPILKDIIIAIIKHREIYFRYNKNGPHSTGTVRRIQPQCLGIDKEGKFKLRGYQLDPEPIANRLFTIPFEGLTDFEMTNIPFNSPGPDFSKGDSAMKIIICELNFEEEVSRPR
jgi:hypothetical protein